MEFITNILKNVVENAGVSTFSTYWFWDEPECPEELI